MRDREGRGHEQEAPEQEVETPAVEEAGERPWTPASRFYVSREASWRAAAAPLAGKLGIAPLIRVDAEAARRTEAKGARGVAEGNVIYLHPDLGGPDTADGREVLIHELMHVAQAQGKKAGPRVDAEAEAAAIARTGDVRAPEHGIDLAQPAADKEGEEAVAEKEKEKQKAPELGPAEPYRWISGSYSLWVKSSWFQSGSDYEDAGKKWKSATRIAELLRHLKAKGIMSWADEEAITYSASVTEVDAFDDPVERVNIAVTAFYSLGLPPGTSALVGREAGGLEVVVQAIGVEGGRGTKVPSTALKQQMFDALTAHTKLPITEAGKNDQENWDGHLIQGTGTFSAFFSPEECRLIFGAEAYDQWASAPAESDSTTWVPGGQAASYGDLTEEEAKQVLDWLKANLNPAGAGTQGSPIIMSKSLLELIQRIEGPPPHLERERILKMLRGSDGKGDGYPLSAHGLQRLIEDAEFQAKREADGFEPEKGGGKEPPPVFDYPLPFRIDQHNDKVISGESVKFVLDIKWPSWEEYHHRVGWRLAKASCDWVFERTMPDGTEKKERRSEITEGSTEGTNFKFNLEPGEEQAVWSIRAYVRHNLFLPATDTTQVEVKTEAKRLQEGRDEAFAGMGAYAADDEDYDFETSTYNEWFGDREYDHGKRFRGELPEGHVGQTQEDRTRSLDAEIARNEALLEYLKKNSMSSDAVEAAEHYLAKLRDAKKAMGKDLDDGWMPFELRGTYLGRGNRFADGPLDLYGAVKKIKFGETELVTVQIRDLSRRFESENYRFQGHGGTFEQALESTFVDLCKNYPAGTVSVLAEAFDPTGTERSKKTVGFELDTGTEWEDTKSVVFDPLVSAIVNIGSALVMIFLPFTAPVLLPLTIAYNATQTIDEMVTAWDNGTMTAGKAALSLAQIGLDLIPMVGRAKVFANSRKAFALLEGFEIAGQAVVMTLVARDQIQKLQDQDVAGMAGLYEKYIQLEKSTHGSDPQLAKMKAELDAEAEKIRGRTLEVVGQLIKDQAISYIPLKAAGALHHQRTQQRRADFLDSGRFQHREGVDPHYDPERGKIVGDESKLDHVDLDALLTQQDVHMRSVGQEMAGELGVDPKHFELTPGNENMLWKDGDTVRATYLPGTRIDAAKAKWRADAAAEGVGKAPDPNAPKPDPADVRPDPAPKPDPRPDAVDPAPSRDRRPDADDHDRPRPRKPEQDEHTPGPERLPSRRPDPAPVPELVEHGDHDAKATTAAAVPGSTFKGRHDADANAKAVKKEAHKRMKAAGQHVDDVRRVERAEEADTFLVTLRDGSPISVRVVSGGLEGDVVARTIVNPTKVGPTRVKRTGKDDKVRTEKVKVEGRYVIQLSDRVDPAHAERALAHELAEIVGERRLAKAGDAVGPDVLRGGEMDADAELSPHDLGRVAEINVLAEKIQVKRKDDAEKRELMALVEHLGLRQGTDGADVRRKLVDEHLTPAAKKQLDRLTRPEDALDEHARADLDSIRYHAEQDAARAEERADYKAPLHDVPDAAAPGVKLTRERAAELAAEAKVARQSRAAETVAWYRAQAATLPDGQFPIVESPQLGAGAALAARNPNQLLVDARGRWQVDASADIAQTASQLRGLKEAGLGDPFEFAGPNERVPMNAVRYWEDTIAAQGPVIDAHARLELADDGKILLVIDKPGDGGPPLRLEVKGTPVVSSGFVPERIPGQKMPPDKAISKVEQVLRKMAADGDPAKAELKAKAEAALAELEPLSGIAKETGSREGDLSKALEIVKRHGLDAEVQGKAGDAHKTLVAGDAWKKLREANPDKMFFGDEANLESLDPTVTDQWVIAGTGGTGISAAEIIFAKNPKAHVTMAGRDIPPGLLENDQFQAILEAHADEATVRAINKKGGLKLKPGDGRFTVKTGVEIGTPKHEDGDFKLADGVEGGGYIGAIGRDNQLPPFVADLVDQAKARGDEAGGEIELMWDRDQQYLGYKVKIRDESGAVINEIDVTGAASRFPPWDLHPLAGDSSAEGKKAFQKEKDRFEGARDLDAPPESGNFDGGFVSSATQAARYGRHRRAEEEAETGTRGPRGTAGDGGATHASRTDDQMAALEQSLPPELRGEIPIVENAAITGNGVRVVYKDGDLRLEVGPDAEPRHVRAHAETARVMLGYRGPIGAIRRLLDLILTKLKLTPGYGTEGFEARLEIKKLEAIRDELEAMAKTVDGRVKQLVDGDLANLDAEQISRELASIHDQLEHHRSRVDSYDPGTGHIAAEGLPEIPVRTADLPEPSIQETGQEWIIELKVKLPDGSEHSWAYGTVLKGKDGGSPGEPQFIFDTRAMQEGTRHAIKFYDDDGKLVPATQHALQTALAIYKKKFGQEPEALTGHLTDQNKLNFQREFFVAKGKKMTDDDAALAAIRNISFGKHRIPLGYDQFEVTMSQDRVSVDLGEHEGVALGVQDVPKEIDVIARKLPVRDE